MEAVLDLPARGEVFDGPNHLIYFLLGILHPRNRTRIRRLFERSRLGDLYGNDKLLQPVRALHDPTAVFDDDKAGELFMHPQHLLPVIGGGSKPALLIQSRFKALRHGRETEDSAQHPGSTGGVAIAVLAAAGGDHNGLFEILFAIEQPHEHEGIVEFDFDGFLLQAIVVAVLLILVILLLHQLPGLLPVHLILPPPTEHVADHFRILGLLRNAFQSSFDDLDQILFEIGLRIHTTEKLPRVHAITIVHHVPELIVERDHAVRKAWGDKTREVRLDPEIKQILTYRTLGMA